jgi:dihydropteroate synthase
MTPLLMGILNPTPDSFFDKGTYFGLERSIQRAQEMVAQGADLLDIGGTSSRPGATLVSEEDEYARVIPLFEALKGLVSVPLSIDSCRPRVVKAALDRGASLINDISGFQNKEMQELAASWDVDVCVMHMQGTPQTMQLDPSYPEGVVEQVMAFFEQQIEALIKRGVKASRIILDPGIGFGKKLEHNLALFKAIPEFKCFGMRVLIGASRKGFMTKILDKPPGELLASTLAMHTIALQSGADLIRAHDIPEHRDIIDVMQVYNLIL